MGLKNAMEAAMGTLQEQADMLFNGNINRVLIAYNIKSYGDFVKFIDQNLEEIIIDIEDQKNLYHDLSEDALSSIIVGQLKRTGLDASHDKNVGGHVDIVIEKDNYQWLGEAKIHSDYDWLEKGLNQLTTRYSSGRVTSGNGAVIIYNKNKDALAVVEKWKKCIEDTHPSTIIKDDPKNPLYFTNNIKHISSGLNYTIKHYCVLLHHKPEDTKKE